jgi:hypothetical protein
VTSESKPTSIATGETSHARARHSARHATHAHAHACHARLHHARVHHAGIHHAGVHHAGVHAAHACIVAWSCTTTVSETNATLLRGRLSHQ